MAPTTTKDEPKQSLYPGDPQAGYVSPDLSTHDGTGTISDEEKTWHEDRNDARQEEADAVAEAEDKAAKERATETEEKPAAKATTTPKSTSSGSGSS